MLNRISGGAFLVLFAGALLAAPVTHAQTTWRVDDDAPSDPGPGDPTVSDPNEDGSAAHPFDAIQEGIDASVDGDTVLVLDGAYTDCGNRDLDLWGKAITVRSENGPDNCIIDCQGTGMDPHRALVFESGETADSIIWGLTIVNGHAGDGVDGDEVWMLHPGEGARLLVEAAAEDIIPAQLRGQHLDGHLSVEHRIVRPVHGRHVAGADGLAQVIAVELFAWPEQRSFLAIEDCGGLICDC